MPKARKKSVRRVSSKVRLAQLRYSAKLRSLTCDITLEEIAELNSLSCHYCQGSLTYYGHNLDRVDNRLGYTRDNVVPCCGECNQAKSDNFSYAEFMPIGKLIGAIRHRRGLK